MRSKITIILILLIFVPSIYLSDVQGQEPDPVIFLNFLTPDTITERIQWAELIAQAVAEIGINVTHTEITGWANISERAWSYEFGSYDYIPTYDEGGYDVLFYGWSWDLDWYEVVSDLYHSSDIPPNGFNFYQYSNATYDSLFDNYINEFDPILRTDYAHQMQEILYEDLPSIGIIYPGEVFGQRKNISGIDYLLLLNRAHRPENWTDIDDNIIKIGAPADFKDYNIFTSGFYDYYWTQAVYSGLFQREQYTRNWETCLAKNYTITPNLSTGVLNISIFLDPNAKFSDGSSVLPEDIKYSYELYMDDNVNSVYKQDLNDWLGDSSNITIENNIPGGEMIFVGKTIDLYPLSLLSLGIIDKSEVEPLFSTYGYSILNEAPGTVDVGWSLVKSCGPFKLYDGGTPSEGFDTINSIVHMVPNEYWNNNTVSGGQQPYLTDLYLTFIIDEYTAFNELILGDIDLMDCQYQLNMSTFEGFQDIEGFLLKTNAHQEMGINMKHPIIGTGELTPEGTAEAAKQIRQAISHVIPRQTIINDILHGEGFLGIIPTPDSVSVFNFALKPYSNDIDRAKQLMENAGYVISIPEFNSFDIILFMAFCIVSVYTIRKAKN